MESLTLQDIKERIIFWDGLGVHLDTNTKVHMEDKPSTLAVDYKNRSAEIHSQKVGEFTRDYTNEIKGIIFIGALKDDVAISRIEFAKFLFNDGRISDSRTNRGRRSMISS